MRDGVQRLHRTLHLQARARLRWIDARSDELARGVREAAHLNGRAHLYGRSLQAVVEHRAVVDVHGLAEHDKRAVVDVDRGDGSAQITDERNVRRLAALAVVVHAAFERDDLTYFELRFSARQIVDAHLRARRVVFDAAEKHAAEPADGTDRRYAGGHGRSRALNTGEVFAAAGTEAA